MQACLSHGDRERVIRALGCAFGFAKRRKKIPAGMVETRSRIDPPYPPSYICTSGKLRFMIGRLSVAKRVSETLQAAGITGARRRQCDVLGSLLKAVGKIPQGIAETRSRIKEN